MQRISLMVGVVLGSVFLAGCSLNTKPQAPQSYQEDLKNSSFLRSIDFGATWESKTKLTEKKGIVGTDVLSIAVSLQDPNVVYLGTMKNGLFVTRDGAETWEEIKFAEKAYAIVLDPQNPQIKYATGVLNNRGKIYKQVNDQAEWQEVYVEPADGTFVSALAISKSNPQILYAGTNQGTIIKTENGGGTWRNISNREVEEPIVSIGIDAADQNKVYFGVFGRGLLRTLDGGGKIEVMFNKMAELEGLSLNLLTLTADPYLSGAMYVGTDKGVFKGTAAGEKWERVNVIKSSETFPVRAIAVNPKNSKEIIYAANKALYRSTDGGVKWSTYELDTAKNIWVLKYNQSDPSKVYAGLRKID